MSPATKTVRRPQLISLAIKKALAFSVAYPKTKGVQSS